MDALTAARGFFYRLNFALLRFAAHAAQRRALIVILAMTIMKPEYRAVM